MLQNIDGKLVYVVEFDTMPELPITGLTEDELLYEQILNENSGGNQTMVTLASLRKGMTYAQILTEAIEVGIITKPGKYGLQKDHEHQRWEVFEIVE